MPSARDIKAGEAYVRMSVRDQTARGLRRVRRRLQAFGNQIGTIGRQLAVVGTVAAAPLALSVRQFARTGDELDKTSARTGVAVESLSELGFAAEQTGSDIATLEKGFFGLSRSIFDASRGSAEAVDALDRLGLTYQRLEGLSPEEQFNLIADGLAGVEDASERGAIAQKLLGRSGRQLLPLLQLGAEGIANLRAEAAALGLTITTQTARDAARFTDRLNILSRVLRVVGVNVGASLAEPLERVGGAFLGSLRAMNEWVQANARTVQIVTLGVVATIGLGGALIGLGLALKVAAVAVSGLGAVLGGVLGLLAVGKAAVLAMVSPLGLLIGLVGGLAAYLVFTSNTGRRALAVLGEGFGELWQAAKQAFDAIRVALAGGEFRAAAEVMWAGIRVVWLQGTSGLRSAWMDLQRQLTLATIDTFYGVQLAVTEAMANVRSIWARSVGFMREAWAGLSLGVRSGLRSAQQAVTELFIQAQGLVDKSLDVEAAIAISRKNESADQRKLEEETAAAVQASQRQEREDLGRIEADRVSSEERVARELAAARQAATAEADAAIGRAEDELTQAEARYREALAVAQAAGAGGSGGLSFPDVADVPEGPDIDSILDRITAGLSGAVQQQQNRGSFFASAARSFGASNYERRTAKGVEEVAENTERQARALERLGVV
ncbi:MAG: hypothetical protein AAGI68_14235 [Planctomycetota bacterium]